MCLYIILYSHLCIDIYLLFEAALMFWGLCSCKVCLNEETEFHETKMKGNDGAIREARDIVKFSFWVLEPDQSDIPLSD